MTGGTASEKQLLISCGAEKNKQQWRCWLFFLSYRLWINGTKQHGNRNLLPYAKCFVQLTKPLLYFSRILLWKEVHQSKAHLERVLRCLACVFFRKLRHKIIIIKNVIPWLTPCIVADLGLLFPLSCRRKWSLQWADKIWRHCCDYCDCLVFVVKSPLYLL